MAAKRFLYKVFDGAGEYIKTWSDVVSELRYKTAVQTGIGEFQVGLARTIRDFGENEDVAFNNRVDVYVFDEDAGAAGLLIASGRITRYNPSFDGSKEGLTVHCLGFVHRLAQVPYIESGQTRFTKSATDPSEMFKDVFDAYTALTSETSPDYSGSSVDATGLSETQEFNTMSCLEALKKILELCPSEWYWFIDRDGTAYLKEKATSAAHTFTIGKNAQALDAEKNLESVINRVYFTGGIVRTTYTDQVQATQDATQEVGTTAVQKLAQSLIPEQAAISGITLYKNADTGTPVERLVVSIQSDLDGAPSGNILSEKDITDDWALASAGAFTVEIPEVQVVVGDTYWLVIEQTAADDSNHFNIGKITAGAYANGSILTYNGSAWGAGTGDLYFQTFYPANLFKVYSKSVSEGQYGIQAMFKQDERITVEDSMDQIAEAILGIKQFPEVRMKLKVTDNNNNSFGYNIESIKPGDTCYIRNLVDSDYSKWDIATWDVSYWDRSLGNIQELLAQVQSVEYAPDYAIIELSTRPPRLAETIEEIERDLKAAKVDNNPDAPSS